MLQGTYRWLRLRWLFSEELFDKQGNEAGRLELILLMPESLGIDPKQVGGLLISSS